MISALIDRYRWALARSIQPQVRELEAALAASSTREGAAYRAGHRDGQHCADDAMSTDLGDEVAS